MSKRIILCTLITLFIVSLVSADYKELGEQCIGEGECISGKCWGTIPSSLECQSQGGVKGRFCAMDADDNSCWGTLVCARIGFKGGYTYRCGECDKGTHTSAGVTPEGAKDDPLHDECETVGTTCSCDMKYTDNNWYAWGRWNHKDDECHQCSNGFMGDAECYEPSGYRCNLVHHEGIRRCFTNVNHNCCRDSDCSAGYACDDDTSQCVAGTTTTTTASTTTTSTLRDVIFNCQVISNITYNDDDVWEYPGYSVGFGDGSVFLDDELVAYNSTSRGNHTLAFIFRDVELPSDKLGSLYASLFLNLKSREPNDVWIPAWYDSIYVTSLNNANFTASNMPSDFDYNDADKIGYSMTSYTAAGNWIPFQVNLSIFKTVTTNGSWASGDNITVLLPFFDLTGVKNNNITFESFDSDPTLAARLCLNYTTTTLPHFDVQCYNDGNCSKQDWCVTGWTREQLCVSKYDSYLVDISSVCYRDHECTTGICSTHNSNADPGDYPSYGNGTAPYDYGGECLPMSYIIETRTNKELLEIGEDFIVYASAYEPDGTPIQIPGGCTLYFEGISEVDNTLTTAWAWSDTGSSFINERNATHVLRFDPLGGKWNYVSYYPHTVNSTVDYERSHAYWVQCIDADGNIGGHLNYAKLRFDNYTEITALKGPPTTMCQNTEFDVLFSYLDVDGAKISGANCTVEWLNENTTLTERNDKTYEGRLSATTSGSTVKLKLFCNHTTYERRQRSWTHNILNYHCCNDVWDKASGETGFNCGGPCLPCDVVDEEKKGAGEFCLVDEECLSNWCYNRECRIPTCYDGIRNQGEIQEDCGGPNCPECWFCVYNNNCSVDGSQYCDSTNYECVIHNCAVDSDCVNPLMWYNPDTDTLIPRKTVCDGTDDTCRFDTFAGDNQTLVRTGLSIYPLSGLAQNKSGTIFYVFNCDEKEKIGFRLVTNEESRQAYSFASSGFDPSYPSRASLTEFAGGRLSKEKTGLITELCEADKDGVGGFEFDKDIMYGSINFKSYSKGDWSSQLVDVVVFKQAIGNIVNITHYVADLESFNPKERTYRFTATNRSLYVWVRSAQFDGWRNISDTHKITSDLYWWLFRKDYRTFDVIYWMVNTSWGEIATGRYGDPSMSLEPPIRWDASQNKIQTGFTFEPWMLYLIAAAFVVLSALVINVKLKQRWRPR